jgi:hypothetical protein
MIGNMSNGKSWVNPLHNEASSLFSGNQKKKTCFTGLFSNWPLASAAPWSVPTQQTVYVVAPTLQLLTISLAKPFLSNTT